MRDRNLPYPDFAGFNPLCAGASHSSDFGDAFSDLWNQNIRPALSAGATGIVASAAGQLLDNPDVAAAAQEKGVTSVMTTAYNWLKANPALAVAIGVGSIGAIGLGGMLIYRAVFRK